MSVTPLDERRLRRRSDIAVAMQRHPAGNHLLTGDAVHVPIINRAHALETLCRRWDETAASFSAGPDCLEPDEAEELLQYLCAATVAPAAVPGLVLMLPQIRAAVAHHDAVRDGDINPYDVGCDSYSQALANARHELNWQLAAQVHGRPTTDMCPDCVRHRSNVDTWQRRGSCSDHNRAL